MNLQKIEELIGKYERAETTLEEEKQLREFFLHEAVPPHLRVYKELFIVYNSLSDEKLASEDFDEKILSLIANNDTTPKSSKAGRKINIILAVAATVLLLIGLYSRYWTIFSPERETYNDPRLAYAETRKVLLKVSATLNSGVKELNKVSEFNDGLSELNKLSAFETGLNSVKKISLLVESKEIITSKN
jgi:hypothetical protein